VTEADRLVWLKLVYQEAKVSGHSWPDYVTAEAALESGFGASKLSKDGNNLLGIKQSLKSPRYDTLEMPTKEFINGEFITVMARWIKYPDIQTCFKDRLAILKRLASTYPEYMAALTSTNGEAFVKNVSKRWATDPKRAEKVLTIYNRYEFVFDSNAGNVVPDKSFRDKLKGFFAKLHAYLKN